MRVKCGFDAAVPMLEHSNGLRWVLSFHSSYSLPVSALRGEGIYFYGFSYASFMLI